MIVTTDNMENTEIILRVFTKSSSVFSMSSVVNKFWEKSLMTTFCKIHTYMQEPSSETETLLREACCQAADFLQNTWSLNVPDCHVYVTSRWQTIMLEQAPPLSKTVNQASLLLLRKRYALLNSLWNRSAGWFQRYGKLCLIAIKPLSDFEKMNLTHSQLYTPMSYQEKFMNTLVHELTHAFTGHLKLPLWLNEGVALLSAEKALGYGAVKRETLEYLMTPQRSPNYYQLPKLSNDKFFYHYAKGYWLTRYLLEQHEDVLRRLLSKWKFNPVINRNINKLFNNQTSDSIIRGYFLEATTS
jgi:hypothetical protein